MQPTDNYVTDRLFAELDKPAFLTALAADDHTARRSELAAALTALDAQRGELAGLWAAGGMSTTEWTAARAGLDQREQALRAELGALPAAPARLVGIEGAQEVWPAMTLDERREFLRLFVARVVIDRAPAGRRAAIEERVTVEWRSAR
jgi:hypothetical protein